MGLFGQNMIYNFMSMYIMFFFTDMIGLPVAIATVIITAASLWDAINDPLMGLIADRTRTKYGKFRPYLLFCPMILAAITILCFTETTFTGKLLVAVTTIAYVLWGTAYTSCDIPIWAISSNVSKDPDQKNRMVTLGKIGGTIGTAVTSICSIMVINKFGGDRLASAYTKTAAIIAIVGCVLMFLIGLILRERVQTTKESIPFKRNIQTVLCNKPLLLLMIALLVINMVNGIRQAVQVYFAVYVWGSSSLLTSIGISMIIGMLIGMGITPKLLEKVSKVRLFIVTCILGFIFCAIPFFFGSDNILFCLIMLGITFGLTGITTITSTSMLIDSIDYSERKLGFRGEGIIFSLNTFLTKLGAMISKAILGVGMVMMSYHEGQAITEATQKGFGSMMYLIPAVCFLITIIPLVFYSKLRKEN